MSLYTLSPSLGLGIYTLSDVSRLLHLPARRVRYWLKEFWNGRLGKQRNVVYSWGEGHNKAINFYTLIEFFTYYQLRNFGVSSPRILKAHTMIANILDTDFPFASTKVLTDGKNVLFSPEIHEIIHADDTLQYNMKEVIEPFCHNVDFDQKKLAIRLWPNGKDGYVVVDPQHQFGQAVIKNTNIPVEMLQLLAKGGESVSFIASLYGVKEAAVREALMTDE